MNETKQNYLDKIYHMLETMLESFVFVDTSKNMTPIYFIHDVNNWIDNNDFDDLHDDVYYQITFKQLDKINDLYLATVLNPDQNQSKFEMTLIQYLANNWDEFFCGSVFYDTAGHYRTVSSKFKDIIVYSQAESQPFLKNRTLKNHFYLK